MNLLMYFGVLCRFGATFFSAIIAGFVTNGIILVNFRYFLYYFCSIRSALGFFVDVKLVYY
jgi:hypothetical protein